MSAKRSIYLDHSATTPMDERVVAAMLPFLSETFGNSHSAHRFGQKAESALEHARETVARVLNCSPTEVIFTSGGSESDNLAIRGVAWSRFQAGDGNHLITTPVEHSAVGQTVSQMTRLMGFESTILPVDTDGLIDVEDFADACKDTTTIASIIYANNEVGSISPLPELAQHAREKNVLLHTDAVQAGGQLSLDVEALGVDLMSLSAHKFYGPKGVGVLYCRDGIQLEPSQTGGSHEEGRRAGTVNVAGIVATAKALEFAYEEHEQWVPHYKKLRDRLIEGVLSRIPDAYLTGHRDKRIPSHASFAIAGVDSSTLLMHLDLKGIAVSGGSACKTGNPEPSSVLVAMGLQPELAIGSLRMTVGRSTTEEDIDYTLDVLESSVEKVRKLRSSVLS